jgi:hypothetical protein
LMGGQVEVGITFSVSEGADGVVTKLSLFGKNAQLLKFSSS